MVDALVLGASGETHGGSSPLLGTIIKRFKYSHAYRKSMEPSLLHELIGNLNLGISPEFSTSTQNSPGAKSKQKIKNKGGNQVVININGLPAERRKVPEKTKTQTFAEGYHAVFLKDNQIYFGKLQRITTQRFISLKDVYYLRNINEEVLSVDLVKLGSEIHAPEDEMHINVEHILFWEKLQDDGPIVTAILNFKEK